MSVFNVNNCMKVTFLAGFLLFFQSAFCQFDLSGLDPFLQKNLKAMGGKAIGLVWNDGKVIYQKELGEDLTIKSPVAAGHCSQWLTAALVMSLVDQSKLKLDDPIGKYLPDFKKYFKGYITIRQCLSHTTGIERDSKIMNKILDKKKYPTLEEAVNGIMQKEISTNPGKEFHYGVYGPALAARVCEVVMKKPFERLIQEKITRPLKMKVTNFIDENGNAPDPGYGAQTSAADYLNFLIMLMNKGVFEGKRVLSEASVEEMSRSQLGDLNIAYAPPATSGFDYGLGNWIMAKDESGKARILTCPGLPGSWPILDLCRKYAAILLLEPKANEPKREWADTFREIIEEAIGECE
ncbi:MAG: hypothetical protein RL732_4 [Bacteroidota bacterium]